MFIFFASLELSEQAALSFTCFNYAIFVTNIYAYETAYFFSVVPCRCMEALIITRINLSRQHCRTEHRLLVESPAVTGSMINKSLLEELEGVYISNVVTETLILCCDNFMCLSTEKGKK